jgi:hypothetical protein
MLADGRSMLMVGDWWLTIGVDPANASVNQSYRLAARPCCEETLSGR